MKTKVKLVSVLDIAKYFVWKSNKEGRNISNKKLQKLLYYAQAWNLAFNKKPLFKEDIEAWIHGPAIKIVYDQYKKYGYEPINDSIKKSEIENVPEKKLLDTIWEVYGKYDARYLEELTHSEQPWQKARENLDMNVNSNNVISIDSMMDFYSKMLKKVNEK